MLYHNLGLCALLLLFFCLCLGLLDWLAQIFSLFCGVMAPWLNKFVLHE